MLPLENRHLEGMEEPIDHIFHGLYVEQVEKAKKSVLDEICEEINVRSDNYRNIRSCYLMMYIYIMYICIFILYTYHYRYQLVSTAKVSNISTI
jgi:hypothetical protein